MIISGIILTAIAVGLLCWLLFKLAVNALPVFVCMAVFAAALHAGAEPVAAILVGAVTAIGARGVARFSFAAAKSPLLKIAIALLLTGPAVFAGYHATLGVARIVVSSPTWREILAVFGSICVGCSALARLFATQRRPVRRSALPCERAPTPGVQTHHG